MVGVGCIGSSIAFNLGHFVGSKVPRRADIGVTVSSLVSCTYSVKWDMYSI